MQQEQRSIEEGAKTIQATLLQSLKSGTGALIGRFGTVELQVACSGVKQAWLTLERNAGVFPIDDSSVNLWREAYKGAAKEADILATGWYSPLANHEKGLLKELDWKGKEVRLRSLEPYYVNANDRWTQLPEMEDQEICVVTSFSKTAETQIKKAEMIWPSGDVLPRVKGWHFVQTGYAPVLAQGRARWMDATGEDIQSWNEAVDVLEKKVMETGAKVVLIGCGGLGMILGARLKAAGKICFVLGGATQVLFGIKGHRWSTHPVISKFWNEAWVWPLLEETPRGAETVEGGCYWGNK